MNGWYDWYHDMKRQKINWLDAGPIKWLRPLTIDQILEYPYLNDAMQMCYLTCLQTTVHALEHTTKYNAIETVFYKVHILFDDEHQILAAFDWPKSSLTSSSKIDCREGIHSFVNPVKYLVLFGNDMFTDKRKVFLTKLYTCFRVVLHCLNYAERTWL